jgi:hypothetical protein
MSRSVAARAVFEQEHIVEYFKFEVCWLCRTKHGGRCYLSKENDHAVPNKRKRNKAGNRTAKDGWCAGE